MDAAAKDAVKDAARSKQVRDDSLRGMDGDKKARRDPDWKPGLSVGEKKSGSSMVTLVDIGAGDACAGGG